MADEYEAQDNEPVTFILHDDVKTERETYQLHHLFAWIDSLTRTEKHMVAFYTSCNPDDSEEA